MCAVRREGLTVLEEGISEAGACAVCPGAPVASRSPPSMPNGAHRARKRGVRFGESNERAHPLWLVLRKAEIRAHKKTRRDERRAIVWAGGGGQR
mgnify:CR=1 FL=1